MSSPGLAPERSLLRVHAWIVALVTLLLLQAALVVTLRQPVTYTSEARIEVLPIATRGAPIAPDMATEREVAVSGSVADEAVARLDTSRAEALGGLDVSVATDTAVLVVDYTATTPKAAYDGAAAFTHSYVAARNAHQKVRIVSVITPPGVPRSGSGADYALVLGVALVIALSLGVAAAWLWDRVSDRVRSSRELERAGPAVIAAGVPLPPDGALATTSSGGRDFAFLAGRLSSMTDGRRDGVRILVTSPRRRSGASAVAANTAAALAGLGRQVVLVDADFSSPGISSLITGSPSPGFAEVLAEAASTERALRATRVKDLRMVPAASSGPPHDFDVDSLKLMLGQLSDHNLVVVDGAALLTSPETAILAQHVDVVLLVADLRVLRRRDVSAALRLLAGLDAVSVAWVSHSRSGGRRQPRARRPRQCDSPHGEDGRGVADPGRTADITGPPPPTRRHRARRAPSP